jgi:hypothetical protein
MPGGSPLVEVLARQIPPRAKDMRLRGLIGHGQGLSSHPPETHRTLNARQLLQQRLGVFQITGVVPFRELPVDRSKQFAGLLRLAVAPTAGVCS